MMLFTTKLSPRVVHGFKTGAEGGALGRRALLFPHAKKRIRHKTDRRWSRKGARRIRGRLTGDRKAPGIAAATPR